MSDINRNFAIRILKLMRGGIKSGLPYTQDPVEKEIEQEQLDALNYAIKALEQEPRKGHWIPSHIPESILDECSECGFSCGAFTFNYCPNCGADMRADRSEEETETWNGIHAQITAPKGTFDKIFNDTEEDIDDI